MALYIVGLFTSGSLRADVFNVKSHLATSQASSRQPCSTATRAPASRRGRGPCWPRWPPCARGARCCCWRWHSSPRQCPLPEAPPRLCTALTGASFAGCSATTRESLTSVSRRAGRAAARLPPRPAAPARASPSAECCRDSSDVHRCAFDAQRTKFKTTCKNFKYYIDRITSSEDGRAAGAVDDVIRPRQPRTRTSRSCSYRYYNSYNRRRPL